MPASVDNNSPAKQYTDYDRELRRIIKECDIVIKDAITRRIEAKRKLALMYGKHI